MNRTFATLIVLALFAPVAQASLVDHHASAAAGADRLLAVQNPDGSMPWIVGNTAAYQNVQGATAMGLLEAYKVTLDADYLAGAKGVRDWLEAYMTANPLAFISSSNVFFLGEYALLTGELDDLDLARDALGRAIARYGSPEALVESIVKIRHSSHGLGALGLWDAALFVRAAHDVGAIDTANAMANALAAQTIVDPFDASQTYHEIGLAGLLFGLGEADALAHHDLLAQAHSALLATRCADGSYAVTYRGVVYCEDPQTTAFAVLGLAFVGDLVNAWAACDWLVAAQSSNGGWDLGGYEIAEVDSEAVQALAACVLPARNGATSYADAALAHLPL